MPEMGGIEATERIRTQIPSNKQPIIVALTADAFQETKSKCLLCGMQEVLTKPVDKLELIQILNHYFPAYPT
jgi:CheY-like chemotaxis protein